MGEDAWVKIKSITLDESKEFQNQSARMDKEIRPIREQLFKEFADENGLDVKELTNLQKTTAVMGNEIVKKAEDFFLSFFAKYVIDWNWVLEDGSDMPKPFNNPEIFGKLTDIEFSYIQGLFNTKETDVKN